MGSRAAAPPRTFGKYNLVELLGQGGMAEVWKARVSGPQGFSRNVVVKRVLPHLLRDPAFVRMFISEARLSARLTHANVVQVFELGEVDGEYFLAMEYVRGKDLLSVWQAIRPGPPPIGFSAYVVREVCRALDYAHNLTDDNGRPLMIVHRDVSPTNVMIGFDGGVKLLDFGIAKALGEAGEHTATGTLKGKFSYMAPEQVEGAPSDHRADLFAAGIILHELLTNRRLFKGGSDLHSLAMVRDAKVNPPSEDNPGVPPELDAICLKALGREPAARYQTASEMALALDELVHREKWGPERVMQLMRETFRQEPTTTLPPATAADVAEAKAEAGTVLEGLGPAAPRPRRRPRGLVLLAGLLVATAAIAGWVATRAGHEPPPAASQPNPALAPVAAAPAPVAAPPAPVEVTVSVSSLPSGAAVSVGDEPSPRGQTPLTLRLPRGEQPVVLRLHLADHDDATTQVVPRWDSQVQLALPAKAPPPAAPPPAEASRAKPAKSTNARTRRREPGHGLSNGELANPFR